MNLLDTQFEKLGTRTWHQVDIIEKESAEVIESFGGPCRGRTYGPLIKSEAKGVAQVLDDLGNPFFQPHQERGCELLVFVPVRSISPRFAARLNTVITPPPPIGIHSTHVGLGTLLRNAPPGTKGGPANG